MKSIVVMTYYQLMHSIALSLTLDEKPILYFTCDYIKADEELLQRIRETNIFHDVIGMSEASFIVPFIDELRAAYSKGNSEIDSIGDRIFEKYLEPYYSKIFCGADTREEIYVYNDFQRHFYYIAKHFENIVGIEDGYKSLEQQIRIHRFKGRYKLIEPFIDKYYPAPLYRHKNIKKIISSADFPDIDDYYKNLLEVVDFAELIERNKPSYVKALLHIFCIEGIHVKENSTLYLGQPLSRAQYCNACENYLYHRKVIEAAAKRGEHVYIKPHPADTIDYHLFRNDHVEVLPKEFPLEVLGYAGMKFERTISFGSTTLVDEIANENIKIYTDPTGKIHDIRKFVRELIQDEKLNINLYLKTREMSPKAYINLYGYVAAHPYINFNITLLLDEELGTHAQEYYALRNLTHRVRQYRATKSEPKEIGLYELQIKKLPLLLNKFPQNTTITMVQTKWKDDFDIYRNYVSKDEFDYFMIASLEDSGFAVSKDLINFLNKNSALALLYPNYTYMDSTKKYEVYLGRGSEVFLLMKRMSNVLFHKSLCSDLDQIVSGNGTIHLLYPLSEKYIDRPSFPLYLDVNEYQDTFDGDTKYAMLIQEQCKNISEGDTYAIKAIAMLLYDYYNWTCIHYFSEDMNLLNSFVNSLPCEDKILKHATLRFAELLLEEQKKDHSKMVIKNEEFFKYSKEATDLLIRKKSMLRAQIRVERGKRIKDFLKDCRDYTADIGGEDFARKLEETTLLRKLYNVVTKREREVT